jgi:hypothetical protein
MSVVKQKRNLSVTGIILSIVLGFVGLLASVGGLTHVASESGYLSTTGTITNLDQKENSGYKQRTKNRCSPIVEFQVNGEAYTSGPDQYATYGKGSECPYSTGDEITVNYDPSDPTNSTVSDSTFDWMIGLGGAAIAIIFGLIIPIRMIRRSRAESRGDLWS